VKAVNIFQATPAERAPICKWMYVRYVRDVQHPLRIIVLSVALLNFIAMALPAYRLREETRSKVLLQDSN
jgi:hypothetical protein